MTHRITAPTELDAYSADELRAAVHASDDTEIVIDFSECEFIDSSGISVLVETHEALEDKDGTLTLAGVSGQVARVLAMTGLDRELDIETVESS